MRPRLALTIGDAAGVGPEIVLRLLAEPAGDARLLLIGEPAALERARHLVPAAPSISIVDDPREFGATPEVVALWEPGARLDPLPPVGEVSTASGHASALAVRQAVRLTLAGVLDGIVTGPIHKEAWRAAGVTHPGHTELLAAEAGAERGMMLLVVDRLRVALATIHVPFREVPHLLSTSRLTTDLVRLDRELTRWFALERPRIAVTGLNPHAGEGGLFGLEEREIIAPAVEAARALDVDAHGPLPADACIPAATTGRWDAVLAMTHDQGLVGVKAVAKRRAVNVTLGLPFPRTSVAHGTAFDIAGTGRASASSLREAVRVATGMVRCNERIRS